MQSRGGFKEVEEKLQTEARRAQQSNSLLVPLGELGT